MGLKEKRLVAELQTKITQLEEELEQKSGIKVPVVISWESFENDYNALYWFESRVIWMLSSVVSSICYDDVGKKAYKESVKGFLVHNKFADDGKKKIEFIDGMFILYGKWDSDSYKDYFTPEETQDFVENNL